ncbi:hypothetical protein [Paenibacillus arenilitoris]|uniref:SWIM zinc finger domain-containing protein n=1 Tax=Paenibacillus arenilitoris TaxID=2772299 RepID=A0A927CNF9_9BACL|nr:hypothetical protein [Paenibacillus arenilitoris]MBD2870522.1 hypothetical protein [Paenibacillus arenilitoris]
MMTVLERAGERENKVLTVDMACLVLEEAVQAFQYADDSDGDIGMLAEESVEAIREAIAEGAEPGEEIRETLFHQLLKLSGSSIFEDWNDYRIELLEICAGLADVEPLRNALRAKIESMIRTNVDMSYQQYANEALLRVLFDLIRKSGTEEETEQFIVDNLRYSYFREALINRYRQEKDYDQAVKLALEGEEQDKDYAGLALRWKAMRHDVYRESGRKEEQASLAEELLVTGNFEYYNELRQLAGKNQEALYERLKTRLKMEEGWSASNVYLRLITEANDLDEMMAYVRENPGDIEQYAGKLAKKFGEEVLAIYSEHIRNAAGFAANRKKYQDVCGKLKSYRKIAGSANLNSLINELRHSYSHKPAFIDELDKVN